MVISSNPLKVIGGFTRVLTLGFCGISQGARRLAWTHGYRKKKKTKDICYGYDILISLKCLIGMVGLNPSFSLIFKS